VITTELENLLPPCTTRWPTAVTSSGWKVKASPSRRCFLHHLEQLGELERGALHGLLLRSDHHGDAGDLLVGVVDDAMHVGALSSVS
jgi:hypothetical protein